MKTLFNSRERLWLREEESNGHMMNKKIYMKNFTGQYMGTSVGLRENGEV